MALRTKRKSQADQSTEPGQDSFLDVVANLIGILIILVMLIGSQAQSVWEEMRSREPVADQAVESLKQEVDSTQTSVAKLKTENTEIESSIESQKAAKEKIRKKRDQLQLAVKTVEAAIKEKEAEFTSTQKENQKRVATVSFLREELAAIKGKTESLQSNPPPSGIIEHLPTPIAKTVFGEEVHFRLSGGRLVHVPLDELVLQMRSEWKIKAKKLTQTPSTIETVGPVDDFRLQYKLVLKEQVQRTEQGVVRTVVPGLDRFILLSTQEPLGEVFADAIRPGSRFSQLIDSLDPNETTISVWVYPDSFGQFGQLKKQLYSRGFLCAGWPLPEGQPISGSPNGFRTAAQ